MAEYSSNAVQTVAPASTVVFTDSPVPWTRGLVRHRDDSGSFLLRGYVVRSSCGCCPDSAIYMVEFGANIAIPTGGTVEPISLALAIDGAVIPSSTMIVTPAAVDEYFNVTSTAFVTVPRGCCFSLSVESVPASSDPTVTPTPVIELQNANLVINRIA